MAHIRNAMTIIPEFFIRYDVVTAAPLFSEIESEVFPYLLIG